jgi:hypothetical protein
MRNRKPREPQAICAATTRNGGTCKHPAGLRTDHPGAGRCYLHGGATPVKHGRYSSVTTQRLADAIARFENDPNPTDLLPELALLRALINDFIERHDTLTEAIISWDRDRMREDKKVRPSRLPPDILQVGQFITAIGNLTDRVQKQKQDGVITLATLDRVLEQLGAEVVNAAQEVIRDPATRSALLNAVERRWLDIRVNPTAASNRPAEAASVN